ncbi:ABC transporter substrate-binding protein [Lacinutrix undariae]
MIVTDQLGKILEFKSTPKRIISLVPSQTELICDLGLEDALVGVTKFCVHPHDTTTNVALVGGTKQIKVDIIKALKPDVILCNKEENTQEIVETCQEIAPVHISDIYTINDTLELIKMYGELFNVNDKALHIYKAIETSKADFLTFIANKPQRKVAYFIWKTPWMVAASNTFIHELLQLNNFENSFKHLSRYPEVSLEDEALQNTDLILLSSEPYPFKEKHIQSLQTTFKTTQIQLVDGEMFSWYGSRLLLAFNYFKMLH